MTDDTAAQLLHDKATRGGNLSAAEQTELNASYERQDTEEAAQIASPRLIPPSLESLNAEVSAALTRLSQTTLLIQAQSDENEKLRQENAALSRLLVQDGPSSAALSNAR